MSTEQLQYIFQDLKSKLNQIQDLKLLEELRTIYLGRKGKIAELIKKIPELPSEERPLFGKEINLLKQKVQELFTKKKQELQQVNQEVKIDYTLPGIRPKIGSIHPITKVIDEIAKIFEHIGFTVVEGPEIETDYYNFQALNIPPGHPARDNFATFYLPCENYLLRSQTSTVQVRIMEKVKPPIRVIAPGKVFRPDNLDASHSFMFHQIEGLVVDKNTNFSHLKGTLSYFVKKFFGAETRMRFRPHYFPFTEPSAEVDISCIICKG
ncbi:MAG TPA: phenylalanine--tRNA ligase subunit alpha, partial [Candidatus Omnitrophica bacterium]|nr:phenylalanine--tRNA ligase subunit alpha [Candidatus Omnitrophota bacterium]